MHIGNLLLGLHELHLNLWRDLGLLVNLSQRVVSRQTVCNDLRTRKVHVAEHQVTRKVKEFLIGRDHGHHGLDSLLTLALVAGAGVHVDIVFTHGYVIKNLFHAHLVLSALVNGNHLRLPIVANDPQNPFPVVNLGDQVKDDPTRVLHRPNKVVVVVEVGHVLLHLLTTDGLARHISLGQLGRIKDTDY